MIPSKKQKNGNENRLGLTYLYNGFFILITIVYLYNDILFHSYYSRTHRKEKAEALVELKNMDVPGLDTTGYHVSVAFHALDDRMIVAAPAS